MKKLICILLVALQILNLSAFASSADEPEFNKADFSALSAIGAFSGFDITGFEESITRAQLAQAVYNIFALKGSANSSSANFIDVGSGHFAYDAVNTLYSLGYVSGISNEFFAPDAAISLSEAVKVVVSALGYTPYAQAKGGYPIGYMTIGAKLDIIPVNAPEKVSGAVFIELLANTLRACPLTEESISDDGVVYGNGNGDSLGKINFDLYEGEGFVSGLTLADMYGVSNGEYDNITINDKEYFSLSDDLTSYVGMYVDFWYIRPESSKNSELVGIAANENCNVINIDAGDIVSFSGNEYIYYKNGKNVSQKIDSACEIFYNGKSVPYFKELMIPQNGNVVLLDFKGNSYCDSVVIYDYINARVNNVDSDSSTILLDKGISYPEIENGRIVYKTIAVVDGDESNFYCRIYNKKGEAKKVSAINKDNIISMYFDPYSAGVSVYYSTSTLTGTVETVDSDLGTFYVKGKEYNVIYGPYISENDIYPGAAGKFLLDYKGNVVYMDSENGGLSSALFIRTVYEKGLSGKSYAELVDIDLKSTLRFEIRDSIKLDGNRFNIRSENDLNYIADLFRVHFRTAANTEFVSYGFVRYKTDANGVITELHTMNSPQFPDTTLVNSFEAGISKAIVNQTIDTIGDKVLYNDVSTVFMDIPYTSLEDEQYLDTAASMVNFMNEYMMGNNGQFGLYYDVYYLDKSDIASIFIKHGTKLTSGVGNSDEYMPQGTFTDMGMFVGKGSGIDDKGDEREIIKLIGTDGVEKKYFVSAEYTSDVDADYSLYHANLKEGDIFAYYVQNNLAGNFLKVYEASADEPMSGFLGAPSSYVYKTGSDKYQTIDEPTATSGKYNTTYRVTVGRVYDLNGYVLKVSAGDTTDDSNLAYFNINTDRIIVYDSAADKNNRLRKGTVADLKGIAYYGEDASKVAVYIHSGKTVTLFVYN